MSPRGAPTRDDKGSAPPRLITAFLSRALPRDRRGRSIVGDLIEEWYARPSGLRRTSWYVMESLRIAMCYLWVRRRLPGTGPGHRKGRPSRRGAVFGRVGDDVRYAARGLRRQAAFTATAVTILALGIGSTTTVFAGFRDIVLTKLPVTAPEQLVRFKLRAGTDAEVTLSPEEVEVLAAGSRTLGAAGGVASFGAEAFPLVEGDRSLVLAMSAVTPDFFQVLGARPSLGRLFRAADGEAGAEDVTVITHDAWQREFGGDPGVLGRHLTLTLTGRTYTVVGVAPPGLDVPVGVGYWVPSGPPGHRALGGALMDVVARLAPGSSPEAARDEVLVLSRSIDSQRSRPRAPEVAMVESLSDTVLGDVRPMMLAVTLAVGLLLLIACVNVGNLLLIRTTQRHREVMVRRALGASAGGIARLLLTESLLIGGLGGAGGLALASWLLRMLPGLAPDRLPRSELIGLAGPPVGMAVGVSVAAVLLFGLVPPVLAARGGIAAALRADARSGSGTRRRRHVRQALVGVQVALAVVLLFGGGLVARSLRHLQGLDLGYEAEHTGIVEVSLDRRGRGPAETFALLASVLDRARATPDITAATWIMSRPFMGMNGILAVRPRLEGQSETEAEANPRFPVEVGGGELFRTLGIPVVRGRGLLSTDREDAPRVAVVSEAVAQRLWPGEDPVGKRIEMVTSRPMWWTVVGVAADTRFRRLREPTPTIYVHYRQLQALPAVWTLAVRSSEDLGGILPRLRRQIRETDGSVNVWRAGSLSDYLDRGPLAEPRSSAVLLSGFGLAALLLAAIGLYGVMALAVRDRTHELGVRRALGAPARRLRWGVLGEALFTTCVGSAAGLGVALLLSRFLAPLLFEVGPHDPVTAIGVGITLIGVGLVAAYIPARRATAVDPTEALRAD